MSPNSQQTVTRDALLAQADFVRSLARALVKDPDRADDVAQQTFVTALEAPPREAPAMRSWLRSVMRNVVRQARRADSSRAALERRRIHPDNPERPDAVAQNRETVRDLVEALLEVREPYQTAIFLRYYENLAPRRIASRLGLPVETVKSRLKRGLRELRARMDARGSGDRATWRASLVGLFGLPSGGEIASQPIPGGESMWATGWTKVLIGASLVITTTALVIVAAREQGTRESTVDSIARVVSEAPREFEPRPVESRAIETPAVSSRAAAQSLDLPFRVTVLDEFGLPIQGARIECVDGDEQPGVPLGATGADGVLEAGAPENEFALVTTASGYATETTTHHRAATSAESITIVLREGAAISGVVRFADGTPSGAGVRVLACREGACPSAYELSQGLASLAAGSIVETDAAGRFQVDGLFAGERYEMFAGGAGLALLRGESSASANSTSVVAIAGGDEVAMVVGYLYGKAARLVEESGEPLRITPRAKPMALQWAFELEMVSDSSASRFVHFNEPTLALAGIDIAAVHPRLPRPKHVSSRFIVSEIDAESHSGARTLDPFGYEDMDWKFEAPRVRDRVTWSEVVMTPSDAIRVGTLRVDVDCGSDVDSIVKYNHALLGDIVLTPEGNARPLVIEFAPGEVSPVIDGIPAGYYHARFHGDGFAAVDPSEDQPAIPVEILEGETATLRFDLTDLGSIALHVAEVDGSPFERRLSIGLEAVDGRTTGHGRSHWYGTLRRAPYRIPLLEPGAYRVWVTTGRHGESRPESIPVTVYHGETTEVTIELPPLAPTSPPYPPEEFEEVAEIVLEIER